MCRPCARRESIRWSRFAENSGVTLDGKVALITGGGRGLGRAFAQELARSGARVAVTARTADEIEDTAQSIGGFAIPCDVTRRDQVTAMVEKVEAGLGPVDILVNNAGAPGAIGPAWLADPAEWWRAMEVNMGGTFLCCHAVVPGMVARRSGRIINVASGAGTLSIPHMSAYVTAKAAVIRFTETLALELASHGVTAFAIQPGTVRTRMAEEVLASEASREWLPWFHDFFAAGRDVGPDAAASLVRFLAEGRADTLSGRYFEVPEDDPAEVVARTEEVKRDGLYLLRLRR